MRKNLIIALSLTVASIANAQFRPNNDRSENRTETDQKKFSFGYFLGTNVMSYKIVPKAQDNPLPGAPQTPDDDGVNQYGLVYLDQESKAGFSCRPDDPDAGIFYARGMELTGRSRGIYCAAICIGTGRAR